MALSTGPLSAGLQQQFSPHASSSPLSPTHRRQAKSDLSPLLPHSLPRPLPPSHLPLSIRTHPPRSSSAPSSAPTSASPLSPMAQYSESAAVRAPPRTLWVQLSDPDSGEPWYANPDTGECVWTLPEGEHALDTGSASEMWWQLYDDVQRAAYYYNTATGATQWTRPTSGAAFIVNLSNIQRHAIGKRVSLAYQPIRIAEAGSLAAFAATATSTLARMEAPPGLATTANANAIASAAEPVVASPTRSTHDHEHEAEGEEAVPQEPIEPSPRSSLVPQYPSLPAAELIRAHDPAVVITGQYKIDGFAKTYFREHKRGLFRRRVPVEKLLVWSKDPLRHPLMPQTSKPRHRDALKCFKAIMRIMGDRPSPASRSRTSDTQWVIERALAHGAEMRDEVYVQVCKQLTGNPGPDSVRRGWELLACLAPCFPPSRKFEAYLREFVAGAAALVDVDSEHDAVPVIARHVLRRLDRTCTSGPRGTPPSLPEIELMIDAPFSPSVFGDTLDEIMRRQRLEYPALEYPRTLVFLCQAVLELGGDAAEGIFRVPGDADAVTELRLRIDRNRYDATGITDPSVPAGLLKYWLRELADPLVPMDTYDACLAVGKAGDVAGAVAILDALPDANRRVARYLLAFLQGMAKHAAVTKMSAANLAMVYAPSFLRCPFEDPAVILENTKYEQQFLRYLLADEVVYGIDVREVPWS
ncbi:hypothetical protein H9P43_002300 [Blastocladiella emersonii ATCC 22665]|nr:hypothetical protein H9P43_002300 [Blastocladiella emersonii ATCC 22665]